MEDRPTGRFFAPSIGDMVFLCVFFWALHVGVGLLADGDTGWHIVTGENILRTMTVPFSDPYSYTLPGIPWTSHEWLAAVALAAVHRLAGLNGVVTLTALVIGLTFFFLYVHITRRGVSPLLAALLSVVAATASALHWLARPHIFSLPLTLAFIVVLDTYQREGRGRLWLLPLLMVLWVNLHAGFILGLILVFMYAGGNYFLYLVSNDGREQSLGRSKALGLAASATVLATFVNPHGPAILYFPFHLVGRKYIMDNVMEWLSPDFHTNTIFEVMLLSSVAVFVLSKRKPSLLEGGAALLLTHMSLYSARYIPLLAIIVTPMVAVRAGEALENLVEGAPEGGVIKRVRDRLKLISENTANTEARFSGHALVYAAAAGCVLVALNGGSFMGRQVMDYAHDKGTFPVDALRFAEENGIEGRMFNNDGWGGYIIYSTYPDRKVFFDGRSDMYGVEFMKEYVKVAKAEEGYEDVLDKYEVEWVLYNANSPICQLLAAGGGWKLVYADTTANILLKDIPRFRPLIEKYRHARFVPKEKDGM